MSTIPDSDLLIETNPGREINAGGQHVGVTNAQVRVVHKPTGLTACCSVERSNYKNKKVCLAMIEYGLAELGYDL